MQNVNPSKSPQSLFVLVFLLLSCAQHSYTSKTEDNTCIKQYDSKLKRNIYSYVDQMPEFTGGVDEFMKYISKNKPAYDEKNIQGTLVFEFVVDVNGAIIDEKIPTKKAEDYTAWDKGLLKVVRSMPKWKPGQCKKRKVPVRIPIRIYAHPSY